MSTAFRYTRTVAFAETDMAGIVHFSNYFRFMEEAEHAFLQKLGHSVHAEGPDGLVCFPRVEAGCSYLGPLRFEQQFSVGVLVTEVRPKSVSYRMPIEDADGTPVAEGKITAVCATRDQPDSKLRAIPIPEPLARAFAEALTAAE